ncbi:MAG: hypothetical protein SO039_03885 [Campylobacter sp.]|nr:hypothetical protein [Campylobacter sp.]MDY4012409.1 hypothetical protein [Campylobacter sp.]
MLACLFSTLWRSCNTISQMGAATKHKNLKILEFLQTRIPTLNSRIPYKILGNSRIA